MKSKFFRLGIFSIVMSSRSNRRFPFERTEREIVVPNHLECSSDQLYPMLRDYLSVNRSLPNGKQQQQQTKPRVSLSISHLNDFLQHLKETREENSADPNNFVELRQNYLQQWKTIKSKWLKYYREENKGEEIQFSHMSSIR